MGRKRLDHTTSVFRPVLEGPWRPRKSVADVDRRSTAKECRGDSSATAAEPRRTWAQGSASTEARRGWKNGRSWVALPGRLRVRGGCAPALSDESESAGYVMAEPRGDRAEKQSTDDTGATRGRLFPRAGPRLSPRGSAGDGRLAADLPNRGLADLPADALLRLDRHPRRIDLDDQE